MGVKIVSPRAELAVLRGMTNKDKKIAGLLLSTVDDTYFDAQESKEIYNALKSQMAKSGESPTFRLVVEDPELSTHAREYFRDSQATITSTESANKAVKILNRYRQLRGLYTLALSIDSTLNGDAQINMDSVLEDVAIQVSGIRASKKVKDAFLHFGKNNSSLELVKDLLYNENNEDTIPTGIKPFDEQSGGFMRGSLVALGASSGGGKSAMANQLAINFANLGYKVVVVPLEMSRVEMTGRIVANVSGLDVTKVLQRRLASGEKDLAYKKYGSWVRRVKSRGGRLTVYKPEEDVSIEDIFAAVSTFECDVLIVDYISLLKGTDGDDSWQQLGAIARVAKINAEKTHRVNVLLCQVNDEGKIRYARAISEHSTNSWIWVTPKDEREKEVGRLKIEQPKARNSKSYPFEIGMNWGHMKVVDVDSASADVGDVAEPMRNLADV